MKKILSLQNIESITANRSDDGVQGVLYIRSKASPMPKFCIKTPRYPLRELAGDQFFKDMGLETANTLLLPNNDIPHSLGISTKNPALIMDFIPGKPIKEIQDTSKLTINVFHQMGEAIVYDAVIANADRFEY